MPCPQQDVLLAEYRKRVKQYAQAVASLSGMPRSASHAEYQNVWTLANNALIACTSAQRQLGWHMVSHGCENVMIRQASLSA